MEVSYTQAMPSVAHRLLLLPADQDVGLSALSPPCLPYFAMMTMDYTAEQPQLNIFLYKSYLGHGIFTTVEALRY